MPSRAPVQIIDESNLPLPTISWESIFFSAKKELKKLKPLTIIFVSNVRSQELNSRYRKKNAPTNVLSFPEEREIVIAPAVVRKEAKTSGFTYKYWMTRLIVHGIVHLEGYNHRTRKERHAMEMIEGKILKILFPI